MMPSKDEIDIDYELPSVVDSIRAGWISLSQNAAIVSGLFASTAAQLLSNIRTVVGTDADTNHPHGVSAMLVCAYGVLIFSSSATITSFILMAKLGSMPVHASGMVEVDSKAISERRERTTEKSTLELLKDYGVGRNWTFLMWHWFISLVVGILLMMVEISLYVFLVGERNAVKGFTLVFIAFAVLPLLHLPFTLLVRKV